MSISDLRDLKARLCRDGVAIEGLDGEPTILAHREALSLLESLLRVMPEVTDGIRKSWELRETPYARVRRYYSYDQEQDTIQIQHTGELWRGKVKYKLRTNRYETADEAYRAVCVLYGSDQVDLREVYDCPGSRAIAEQKQREARLVKMFRESGLTMQEFVAQYAGKTIDTATGTAS